jgi:MFS family permease
MVALVATSFSFIIRAFILDDWADEFGLSQTQKGELFGAGLWPFAISIIAFSLVIDRIGYGVALWFAFACHVVSAVVTINATGYEWLYVGNVICALGNGTVEAVINPVVAAMFVRQKTKWLNILHAGWPGGLVIGGLLTLAMLPGNALGSLGGATASDPIDWRWKVGLLLIPTLVYGGMLLGARFPVSERVAAGVSYRAMLAEFGGAGMLIAAWLVFVELGRVWGWPWGLAYGLALGTAVGFGAVSRSLGRPLFVFLLLLMILVATTELGTDAWIKSLMTPVMAAGFGLDGGWVLVYTATIMIVLRVFCGPIVRRLNPLGLLCVSSLLAAAGIASLSISAGVWVLIAATVYGVGQTFFWPTTLGLVAERFPRGGALTLNAIAGVGMLGVGIVGAPLLGNIQDRHVATTVQADMPETAAVVFADEATPSVLGRYRKLDEAKVAALPAERRAAVSAVQDDARQRALLQVAALPLVMFACYLGLIAWFRSRGGYAPQVLVAGAGERATG